MDWSKFGEFGLSGLLMSVIAFFAWLLLTKTLDSREKDLAWHRDEMMTKRKEFTEALRTQQEVFTAALKVESERWERVTDAILERLDQMGGRT